MYVTAMKHTILYCVKYVIPVLCFTLQAVDTDGSGEISIEEYKMFYACLGLSEEVSAILPYLVALEFIGIKL